MSGAINAFTEDLKNRLRLLVGRCLIKRVSADGPIQTVQGQLLADETQDDMEHLQQYGYASHPLPGAEAVVVFMGGNRDHGMVIATGDRRYGVKLVAGEVALYDNLGHVIHLKRDGISIDGAGHQITLTNTPLVRLESSLDVTGEIRDHADSGGKSMSQMRSHQVGHTHKTNAIGAQTDAAQQEI